MTILLILYDYSNFGPSGIIGLILLLAFPICGAYRLARFNTASFDGVFTGVPITIAGCFMAIIALLSLKTNISIYIVTILMILFAYLMVSKLKLKKF